MNCAMVQGMTTNVNQDSAIGLFNHQMIPHHQNAVNMCKALIKLKFIECLDIENEEDSKCVLQVLCQEIINVQNAQIQTMRGVLEALALDPEDDCIVPIKSHPNDEPTAQYWIKNDKKNLCLKWPADYKESLPTVDLTYETCDLSDEGQKWEILEGFDGKFLQLKPADDNSTPLCLTTAVLRGKRLKPVLEDSCQSNYFKALQAKTVWINEKIDGRNIFYPANGKNNVLISTSSPQLVGFKNAPNRDFELILL